MRGTLRTTTSSSVRTARGEDRQRPVLVSSRHHRAGQRSAAFDDELLHELWAPPARGPRWLAVERRLASVTAISSRQVRAARLADLPGVHESRRACGSSERVMQLRLQPRSTQHRLCRADFSARTPTRTHVRVGRPSDAGLAYEHMFSSPRTSTLAQRVARCRSASTRSFLLLEDDYDVDWEVDRDERCGGHASAPGGAARALGPRRAGQPPSTPQVVPRRPVGERASRADALRAAIRAARVACAVTQAACAAPLVRLDAQRQARDATVTERRAARRRPVAFKKTGGVLLSQALASQVPSALRGLTALFGMGRGVSPSPKPPEKGERPRPPRSFKTAQRHSGYHKKIRQALDPLVPVSFGRYRPSRSGLSTWWSTRGLTPSRGWESSS